MRLLIAAVGRIGPRDAERTLIDDYRDRATRTGRPLGLGPLEEIEVEDRKGGGMAGEGALLARAIPAGARIVALDERGRMFASPAFAAVLAGWRDGGAGVAAFVIGGADGIDPDLRDRAELVLSFGPRVWPHRLARAMLAEQLYRATTILAGTPYHRA